MAVYCQGCPRFSLICANSCAPYKSITMETFPPARCKTAKIHRNEHTPGHQRNATKSFVCRKKLIFTKNVDYTET